MRLLPRNGLKKKEKMTPNDDNKSFENIRHAAERKAALRNQAEEQALAMEQITQLPHTPEEIQRIVHELHVHQIELEMQNEELRTAQARIEAGRVRYFNLYDMAPVGYCTVSEQGLFLEANLTAATLLSVARSDLVKQPISRFILKEDQDIYYLHKRQLFLTGEPQECELRLVRQDGTLFWAHLTATVAQAEDGVPVCRVVLSDITERKQMEKALKASEMRFKEILRNADSVAVQGYALDGTVRYWNRASETFYGYSAKEALGRNLLDLIIPPEMGNDVKAGIRHMIDTGKSIPAGELELIRKDGSYISVYSSHALVNVQGEEPELFCIDVDITDRKATEQALREVNKKLNILSSITRHDINNQLSIILGSLDLLEENTDLKDVECITMASAAAKRISSMIQFTSEYEMIGVNTPVWHDLKNLIETVIGMVHLGSISAECIIPARLLIYADPLITKMFYNIIENAVRYGGTISEIRLFARQSGDEMIIVCEDDGNGILDREKEKIFEKGFGKNTGMGLFFSREILSITGISIRETGEPGKGARFEMTVPEGKWRNKRECD